MSNCDGLYLKLCPGPESGGQLTDEEMEQFKARNAWENAEVGTEYWTGKRWIDGKKIYGKIVDFGELPNNSTKNVPTNIDNLYRYTSVTGIGTVPGNEGMPLPLAFTVFNSVIGLYVFQGQIKIITAADYTRLTGIITLEYTCTDR